MSPNLIWGHMISGYKRTMELYISPNSLKKERTGSIDAPFKSICEAKEFIRKYADDINENITVWLRGGIYNLKKTEVFTSHDGGKNGYVISYRAYRKERPVIQAVLPVSEWKQVNAEILQYPLDDKILNNLYEAPIPQLYGKFVKFYTLYQRGKRLSCAKSNSFTSREPYKEWVCQNRKEQTLFLYDKFGEKPVRDYDNICDIRLHTLTSAAWQYSVLPLESVDLKNKTLKTAIPCVYKMTQAYYWGNYKRKSHLENSIYFIKKDKDWAVDTLRGRIYFYSKNGVPQNVEIPVLTELFRIEGIQQNDGKFLELVKNLKFEGLTFTKADMYMSPQDYLGKELQHGWDFYDTPNAMVRVRGVENIEFKNCRFVHAGSAGFRGDLCVKHLKFTGNYLDHLGMGGVLLCGYGPGKLDCNRENVVYNNFIRRIGEIYYGSNGIFLWQSGYNKITHNRLEHLPYSGIVISGRIVFSKVDGECCRTIRWNEIDGNVSDFKFQKKYLYGGNNRIEWNDLSFMVERLGDGNGIYISGTADGNYIGNNMVRDTISDGFVGGIRMDDNQYGTVVENNIVCRVGIGCGIENKQVNTICNNYIVDLRLKNKFWFSYLASEFAPVKGARFHKNILYAKEPGNVFFDKALYGEEFNPYEMILSENLYFCENKNDWAKEHLTRYQEHKNELKSLEANPLFQNIDLSDFKLKTDSPAYKLGIKQIQFQKIGLTEDFSFFKGGKPELIYICTEEGIKNLQMSQGENIPLKLQARNHYGVPIKVNANDYILSALNQKVIFIDGYNVYALQKGKDKICLCDKKNRKILSECDVLVL